MKKLKSLNDEQFNVLKKNEMFNINGGKPKQKTKNPLFRTYDTGSGYEIDSFEFPDSDLSDDATEPPSVPQPYYNTYRGGREDHCGACE